jgi:hypothetical protein
MLNVRSPIAEYHPALSGGQHFRRVERYDGERTETSHWLSAVSGTQGDGTVFDDGQAAGPYLLDLGGESEHVGNDNRLGSWGQAPAKVIGVDVEGGWIDIDHERLSPY